MATKRRKLVLLTVAAGLAALGLVAWAAWPLPADERINQDAYDRIRKGQPRAEVERLIGLPPGDYTSFGFTPGPQHGFPDLPPPLWWASDDGHLTVWVDAEGRVVTAGYAAFRAWKPSLESRARRWVRGRLKGW